MRANARSPMCTENLAEGFRNMQDVSRETYLQNKVFPVEHKGMAMLPNRQEELGYANRGLGEVCSTATTSARRHERRLFLPAKESRFHRRISLCGTTERTLRAFRERGP